MARLSVRPAHPGEHGALSQFDVRAKRMWGYDDAFMAIAAEALTVTREMLESNRSFVAESDGTVAGYCLLVDEPPVGAVLHLFVDPKFTGRGIGRKLMSDAMVRAGRAG